MLWKHHLPKKKKDLESKVVKAKMRLKFLFRSIGLGFVEAPVGEL